jgi:hypothetical protein
MGTLLRREEARHDHPLRAPPPPVTDHWLSCFFQRHPEVYLDGGVARQSDARLRAVTTRKIIDFETSLKYALGRIRSEGKIVYGYISIDEMGAFAAARTQPSVALTVHRTRAGCSGADIKGRPCRRKYAGPTGLPCVPICLAAPRAELTCAAASKRTRPLTIASTGQCSRAARAGTPAAMCVRHQGWSSVSRGTR